MSGAAAETADRYDVVVVGGGINGAGIARDAAGRGLRVMLCEQGDLANYTSSASTKLVHGGLRYLEYYEFRLVRKALAEREVLLGIAPHIIWPLRFVMPHVRELRPAWMIRAGLFLYDHLGGRKKLAGSRGIDLRRHPAGEPLQEGLTKGFVYSDCWVQDARLVVLNCRDAADRGATVLPRTRCVGAERNGEGWLVGLEDTVTGSRRQVHARAVVNAAGPWVGRFLGEAMHDERKRDVHLVKGSHIVVPKLFEHDHAYLFQHTDGRVIFAIPYEGEFTLIGTTDVAYEGDPATASASAEEIDYLCQAVNRYFRRPVSADDVVWTYSGVRALYDEDDSENASALSRDYTLDLDTRAAPLLSVFGGKITTYRTLAREAVDRIAPLLGAEIRDWTGTAALPGGDIRDGDFEGYLQGLLAARPWLPESLGWRLARNYGRDAERILGAAQGVEGLGEHFGADLYEAELRHLAEREWAMTGDDAIWRRSKLGLQLNAAEQARVAEWFQTRQERGASAS
ncbi:glycerol-3-phosphate dehydrogenase [Sediminicurvatus halobius]|uniref:Glycerol-3-phosphate dehydrogenase n=1 Tax=Sediminicurvatus halobius TaxID=2182432 RepID=A0A2U2N0L4_9GAMM|nr:glycerol-3-phosphate dehydrogenase [Spiribacter halobius]PWG62583.1 glycerol-3-phosphate dehydrogenase [Spiribacter halobius]UEX78501.1 glycerol-3-phosphate dehydrogenase [Spiribacter halobius]